jgi:hypothetical protein
MFRPLVAGGRSRSQIYFRLKVKLRGQVFLEHTHCVTEAKRVRCGIIPGTMLFGPRVEEALRVVRGDENGTRCLAVELDHPVTRGYKYRDVAIQVGT